MMKTTLESMVTQTFKGKIFLQSEFHDSGDMVFDIFDQEVCSIDDLIGKKIIKVRVVHLSENDVGLAFTFNGFSDPIFFRDNCNITVSD